MDNREAKLKNDCKKYLGMPPYNGYTNVVIGDPYFYRDIVKIYGEQKVIEMIELLKKEVGSK